MWRVKITNSQTPFIKKNKTKQNNNNNSEPTLNGYGGAVFAIKLAINVKMCFIVWNTVSD